MYPQIKNIFCLNQASINFGLILLSIFFLGYTLIYCTELKNKINKKRIFTQLWMYLSAYLVFILPVFITAIALIPLIFFTIKELFSFNQQLGNQNQESLRIIVLLSLPLSPLVFFIGVKYLLIYIYFLFLLASFLIIRFYQVKNMASAILLTTVCCLLCLSLNSLIFLRAQPQGMELCLFVLFLTNAFDSFALLGGSLRGKNKLCYELSPGKTIEGLIIALAGTLFCGFIFNYILTLHFTWWLTIIISMVIATTSQLGDLLASIGKRTAHIKDFGAILPGHGGILDRCDSLLLSFPAVIALLSIFSPNIT